LAKIISGYGETGTLMYCDNTNWYNPSGSEFDSNLTKLYMHLPFDSSAPHLEIYLESIPPKL